MDQEKQCRLPSAKVKLSGVMFIKSYDAIVNKRMSPAPSVYKYE
jgi:hypothetical protein